MGSHYIPVGKLKIDKSLLDIACPAAGYGETPPDPVLFCPANGFYPDESKEIGEPDWYPIPEPSGDEILLLYSDLQEKKARVRTFLTGTGGKYKLQVYGYNGIFISESAEFNSNSYGEIELPFAQGVPSILGYSTYMVRVVPTTANNIKQFYAYYQVLEAKFHTPYMESLHRCFYQIKTILSVEFYAAMPNLTSLEQFAYQSTVEKCTFSEMTGLTTMKGAFYSSSIRFLTLPSSLPNLLTLEDAFRNCNLLNEINYPEMPLLQSMYNTHYTSALLRKVTFPSELPELTTLYYSFYACSRLRYVSLPSSLPKLQTMRGTFLSCTALESIEEFTYAPFLEDMWYTFSATSIYKFDFPASMLALNIAYGIFYNCKKLVSVTMPTSAPNMGDCDNLFSGCISLTGNLVLPNDAISITRMYRTFYLCSELESVTLPTSLNFCTSALQTFYRCSKLESLVFPQNMNAVTTMNAMCEDCINLTSIVFPKYANLLSDLSAALKGCYSVTNVTMPDSLPSLTTISAFIYNTSQVGKTIPLTISPCTFGSNNVLASNLVTYRDVYPINWPTLRVAEFSVTNSNGNCTSVIIDYANSSFDGPFTTVLNFLSLDLSATELNRIFSELPIVVSEIVNISYNPGVATCDPSIAEAKGWTVKD